MTRNNDEIFKEAFLILADIMPGIYEEVQGLDFGNSATSSKSREESMRNHPAGTGREEKNYQEFYDLLGLSNPDFCDQELMQMQYYIESQGLNDIAIDLSVFEDASETAPTAEVRRESMRNHPSNGIRETSVTELYDGYYGSMEEWAEMRLIQENAALFAANHSSSMDFEDANDPLPTSVFEDGNVLENDDYRLNEDNLGTVIEDKNGLIFMLDEDFNRSIPEWYAWGDKHPSNPSFPARIIRLM